tara:strand:- start:45 stop:251 length:207 start_codon:yes stop_codon:yes gene_type:complete
MTRQDYILIAKVLKECQHIKVELNYPHNFTHTINYGKLMKVLCARFENDNPRFDEDIFRTACGEIVGE